MMLTWADPLFDMAAMNMYKQYGADTIYRMVNTGNWNEIEVVQGQYNFDKLRQYLQLAKDAGLNAIPNIDCFSAGGGGTFSVPQWFIDQNPDCTMKYGDGTTSKYLSLAWFIDAYNTNSYGYITIENFVIAFLNELKNWNNVIGVELPWELFAGGYYRKFYKGTWSDIQNSPGNVYLAGFDKYYINRWNIAVGSMLYTWLDYKNSAIATQNYWQNWAESINGDVVKILLNIIHNNFQGNIVIRKHYWSDGDIPTIMQLNRNQFNIFMNYIRDSGIKNIIIDNDAFFDPGLISNSIYTKDSCNNMGILYMGEDGNDSSSIQNTLNNVVQVRPNVITFVPYPGEKGEQIMTTTGQQIVAEMGYINPFKVSNKYILVGSAFLFIILISD